MPDLFEEVENQITDDDVGVKLVDVIPPECGVGVSGVSCFGGGRKRRRRPTIATDETERCSEDELSEVNVVAVALSDSENASDICDDAYDDDGFDDEDDDLMILFRRGSFSSSGSSTPTKIKSSSSNCCQNQILLSLLEENQRSLQALFSAREGDCGSTTIHKEVKKIPQSVSSPSTSVKEKTRRCTGWNAAHQQFEWEHSVPGAAALILYATAYAATYELISNLVFEAVDRAPMEFPKWTLYLGMLIFGSFLARISGLVWHFTGPLAFKRVKFVYHNRIRLGAIDARWLYWLQEQGELVLGVVHMVSYYLCYIAVVYFVGQLAVYCDQRDDLFEDLPSAVYKEELQEMMGEYPIDTSMFQCPAHDHSPEGLFGQHHGTTATGAAAAWDPLACPSLKDLEIFGPEDEQFFFQTLSKNSYDNFLGQEHEIPMWDAPHQISFYSTVIVASIVVMKTTFGFNFGSGW